MKRELKIMFMAVALLGLFACSNDEEIATPGMQGTEPICFNRVSTRAGLSDLQNDGIRIWASMSNEFNTSVPLLTNEPVTYAGGEWSYTNTRYWVEQSHFYFIASYPNDESARFEEISQSGGGNTYTLYTLDVETPDAADEDILVAKNHTDTSVVGYSTTVPLAFSHLLTKVNFKMKQDYKKDPDNDYTVTKVTLSGVKRSAQCVVYPPYEVLGIGDFFTGWDFSSSTTAPFVKDFSSSPIRLRDLGSGVNDYYSVWNTQGLLLIPQAIEPATVRIRVDYIYHLDGSDSAMDQARYVEANLPATDKWTSGTEITYTFAIAEQNDISFGMPTIEPWGAPQTGGTIIIK